MKKLPKEVINAWKNRKEPIVFTTYNKDKMPNSIYVKWARMCDDNKIILADNFFHKTQKNILSGSRGSILFITGEKKSYQIKGRTKYQKAGLIFDDMKKWNPERLPGKAAAIVEVEEAYSGAKKIL